MNKKALLALFLIIGAAAPSAFAGRFHARSACAEIAAACEAAGFVRGDKGSGRGVQADCQRPLVTGAPQPRRASLPLPTVDPQLIEACRASNPKFAPASAADNSGTPPIDPEAAPASLGAEDKTAQRPPNIVFVLTDDQALNLVQYMPRVIEMQKQGVTFANYFVTDSLCCPSRSSIFTGRYPHNTGIFTNTGSDGGYAAFHDRGHEQATFATALQLAGYRTAMLGKYLNGYQPKSSPQPPGWNFWAVAGNGYPQFSYDLNVNGKLRHYGNAPSDYLTDVLSGLAVEFIKQEPGKPFFIEVATFSPHAPYTPAPRDANAFPGLTAPRTAAFDAAPAAGAPSWLARQPALSSADTAKIDHDFRLRAQSVLSIDALIGALQNAVAAIGETENTYFVFSSDNGYHMGEHRLMPGKMTAFDTDIHEPLIITGPGAAKGLKVNAMVENIDLCPTFTDWAGMIPSQAQPRALVSRGDPEPLAKGGADRTSWTRAQRERPRSAASARRQSDNL
jgi:arylsulfatase A-like enzyme